MKSPQLTPWQVYQSVYVNEPVSIFLDSVTFQKPNQRYSLIGCEVRDELILTEKDLLSRATGLSRIESFFARNPGLVFGYFSYEAAQLFESIRFRKKKALVYPAVYLVSFKKLLRFDHKLCRWLGTDPFAGFCSGAGSVPNASQFKVFKFKPEISRADFLSKVKKAKTYIEAGDIYQANLSQKFLFDYKGSPLSIYEKLRKINPSPFSSFLKIRGLEIACSSPERLVQKRGSFCETRPIAGTCPKGLSEKALKKWRKKLLGSSKERAEHLMLVDLERNDLGRVCDFKSVKVDEFMTLEKYSHVVHLVSSIVGKLRKDKTALDLLGAMFPGGTITGCPKIRCMEIIDALEPSRRGLYTGSIGYFAPSTLLRTGHGKKMSRDMDLNIVIRTLIFKNGKGSFQVGAGIVHDSVPEKEYLETLAKGEAMMQALAEASATS